ncbi:hypothetical protein SprV_0501806300 [Sparganum proliferum]
MLRAQSLSHFYQTDLTRTLENIAENVEDLVDTGDSDMREKETAINNPVHSPGSVQLPKGSVVGNQLKSNWSKGVW